GALGSCSGSRRAAGGVNGITDPVRFEFLRAAAASNRRLWSRYRFRISLRSAASTKCVSALAASHFRGRGTPELVTRPDLRRWRVVRRLGARLVQGGVEDRSALEWPGNDSPVH